MRPPALMSSSLSRFTASFDGLSQHHDVPQRLRRVRNPDRIGEWQSRDGRIARDAEGQSGPELRGRGGGAAKTRALISGSGNSVARSGAQRRSAESGLFRAPEHNRLERRGDRQRREASERTSRPAVTARPGLARRKNEPPIPEGVDTRSLHAAVRAELRSLPKDLAEIVAAHLVVAGQLVDDDPELAYAHAEAARRRAARLPIVREAAAETAYAAGRYDVALSEFRALRRMTGSPDYLPVMADCERALGRPHNASSWHGRPTGPGWIRHCGSR